MPKYLSSAVWCGWRWRVVYVARPSLNIECRPEPEGWKGGISGKKGGAWGLVKLEARGSSYRPGLGPALEAMAPGGKGIQQMTLLVLPTAHCPDGPVRGNKSDPARIHHPSVGVSGGARRVQTRDSTSAPVFQASWVPCTRAEQALMPGYTDVNGERPGSGVVNSACLWLLVR